MAHGNEIDRLLDGYKAFRRGAWEDDRAHHVEQAERGQSPKVMVVACCDSRVDPATILGAKLGELFVVRNVANLVPPFEPHGDYHGTSAALEFAVTGLGVGHIVVLGHARCGGVEAFLKRAFDPGSGGHFIAKWMSIMNAVRGRVLGENRGQPDDVIRRALEEASVLNSLDNLLTFPFIRDPVSKGELRLHAWYFDIASGELQVFDAERKAFAPVA